MRYSVKHKAQTHERLVSQAAKQFRRKGVRGTGIARLMGDLGLTHGGFYAHFDSKDGLVAQAASAMFAEGCARLLAAAEAAPQGKKVTAMVNIYLSEQQRDSPQACPLAGLAGEMARQPASVRNAYTKAMTASSKRISAFLSGANAQERHGRASLMMAGMAGSLMVARSLRDRAASNRFLAQARKFYATAFEPADKRKVKK